MGQSTKVIIKGKGYKESELDRILAERAKLLAKHIIEDESPKGQGELNMLLFRLQREGMFAIDSQFVLGVLSLSNITDLPHMPSFVLGCVHWNNTVLGVIDLSLWWSQDLSKERDFNPHGWVIVLGSEMYRIGILADDILAHELHSEEAVNAVSGSDQEHAGEISGILENQEALLDVPTLCTHIVARLNRQD